MKSSVQITLMDHVRELRRRLIWCVGVFLLGGMAGYIWRAEIISFLQSPLHQQLYYTSPAGSFNVIMQVCAVAGLILALPVIVFHLLRFAEPALLRPLPKRLLTSVVISSLILATGGAAFAYYLSLPVALQFFGSVGTSHLEALISVDTYFRFVFTYLTAFAIIFQLPLVLLVIDHIFPLGPGTLRKWRKFVVVGAFGLALITPTAPDPLSQLFLAVPIIGLYELSIFAIWLRLGRRPKPAPELAPAAAKSAPTIPSVASGVPRRALPPALPVLDLRGRQPEYFRPASVNVLDLRVQK